MIKSLKRLFRRKASLTEMLAVEFDDHEVRVIVLAELEDAWNQAFAWSNIRRVCFEDGGMMGSDVIYVSLLEPDKVCTIPTEARGGTDFFGALCDKGYFPEAVWRRAIGDTSGGLHCWPED